MHTLTRFSILSSVQANPKLREFRYRPLQFEEELDTLFNGNSATRENSWVPTGGESLPSEGVSQDYFDHDGHSEFMESLNTITNMDAPDVVEELKHARSKNLKKSIEKGPARSRGSSKGKSLTPSTGSRRWPNPWLTRKPAQRLGCMPQSMLQLTS